MDDTAWNTADDLSAWLDRNNPVSRDTALLLRIMKITEEAGEVTAAVIGATGQNPRKGQTHTWTDVQDEICDVILTAMVALASLTPDARTVFAARIRHVAERAATTRA